MRMGGESALNRELVGGKGMLRVANSRGCFTWLKVMDKVAKSRHETQ
jgi:hypothetical protein